ncbi:TPA: hypothetical protein N0F65_003642, partial [Lagenidium giganteum]
EAIRLAEHRWRTASVFLIGPDTISRDQRHDPLWAKICNDHDIIVRIVFIAWFGRQWGFHTAVVILCMAPSSDVTTPHCWSRASLGAMESRRCFDGCVIFADKGCTRKTHVKVPRRGELSDEESATMPVWHGIDKPWGGSFTSSIKSGRLRTLKRKCRLANACGGHLCCCCASRELQHMHRKWNPS